MARTPLLRHELLDETLITCAPANGKSPAQFPLYPRHLLVKLSTGQSISRPSGDGVHGREFEQADGLFDMVVLDHGR